MKYYLSAKLITDLVLSNQETKSIVEKKIYQLINQNNSIYTSTFSIELLFSNAALKPKIVDISNQLKIICDSILSFSIIDLNLANNLLKDYPFQRVELIELAICINSSIDCILDTSDEMKFQKMISFLNIIRKSN